MAWPLHKLPHFERAAVGIRLECRKSNIFKSLTVRNLTAVARSDARAQPHGPWTPERVCRNVPAPGRAPGNLEHWLMVASSRCWPWAARWSQPAPAAAR